ncbi:DUF2637 domain-containing protein [Kribbella sp. NPDC051620]|uniref:DUF2637 domain-containing protein n=1 Tax=Kribbella sp. NPDC051620 TaxID=3364120 RepID=UPI0037B4E1DB
MNNPLITLSAIDLPSWAPDQVTGPMLVAGGAGLLTIAALVAAVVWVTRRAVRAVSTAVESGRWTTRRVLIVVAIMAALGVAGIGGARSFGAVSEKFDSPLVPLVADGMIIACTALRLAALTRGWRIPGALVTTYVFIGGTVWLNIDTATGIADALAHALAPLAYAVLVEMLAHLLRLHMKLAQPAKPRLSALTWFTSPVITTRVWLHLSRTGADDPAEARALVQQVVRMASRLATLCPSYKLWPFDPARAARSACLQTIRDGLLSAGELAALLPAAGRLTPGELLGLVDSAALGLTIVNPASPVTGDVPDAVSDRAPEVTGAPLWLVAFLIGALRTAPQTAPMPPATRTEAPASECTEAGRGAPAPVHAPHRTDNPTEAAALVVEKPSDDELLAVVQRHAAAHGGAPLSQREIRRATEEAFGTAVGFGRAKRLQEAAGWADSAATAEGAGEAPEQTRGQLLLLAAAGEADTNDLTETRVEDSTDLDLETSSSR